jgi:hypothetical protein
VIRGTVISYWFPQQQKTFHWLKKHRVDQKELHNPTVLPTYFKNSSWEINDMQPSECIGVAVVLTHTCICAFFFSQSLRISSQVAHFTKREEQRIPNYF